MCATGRSALAAALLYLDTNEVLHSSKGKAVFRAAMTIQLIFKRVAGSSRNRTTPNLRCTTRTRSSRFMSWRSMRAWRCARSRLRCLSSSITSVSIATSSRPPLFCGAERSSRNGNHRGSSSPDPDRSAQPRAAGHRGCATGRQSSGAGRAGFGQDQGDRPSGRMAVARMHGASRRSDGPRLQPFGCSRGQTPTVGIDRTGCCWRQRPDTPRSRLAPDRNELCRGR